VLSLRQMANLPSSDVTSFVRSRVRELLVEEFLEMSP